MPSSNATVTVSKFDIGPCRVTYDGLDLGGTLSNVTVNFKYEKADMKADQAGTTILDQAVSGLDVTVETEIAEVTNNDVLKKIFPNATPVEDSPKKALDFGNQVGERMLATKAKELILHPLNMADAELGHDWTFYKAAPTEESSYVFSPTDQGKMKIVWRVLLDLTVDPPVMFRLGDSSI